MLEGYNISRMILENRNILNIKGFLFQCVVTMLVKQKWKKCLQEFSLSAHADSTDQQILTGGISPNISILRVS